jgi:hypothetical protein
VPGDMFRVGEIYTWTGKPNEGTRALPTEVGKMIVEYEIKRGWRTEEGSRVRPGAADAAIFNANEIDDTTSIADEIARRVRIGDKSYRGPRFVEADKGSGSRKLGWQVVRERLDACLPKPGESPVREKPGLFVWDVCGRWLDTVPSLPRDEDDPDDVDTDAEDHAGDETRYECRRETRTAKSRRAKGV